MSCLSPRGPCLIGLEIAQVAPRFPHVAALDVLAHVAPVERELPRESRFTSLLSRRELAPVVPQIAHCLLRLVVGVVLCAPATPAAAIVTAAPSTANLTLTIHPSQRCESVDSNVGRPCGAAFTWETRADGEC